MSPTFVSFVLFACFLGASLLAVRLRMVLPEHHMSSDTKETVKLTMGLVATMTALVLGLLVSSTKEAYDTEKSEVTQMAAKIIYLDRVLASYGPESAGARQTLRQAVETMIGRIWPREAASPAPSDPSASWSEGLSAAIRKLSPQNDAQRTAQNHAVTIADDLGEIRWLLFEQGETSISMPMLLIVITWIVILFFSFGLFAPANATALGALTLSALSVAGAVFLILEMDHPFEGLIEISSKPMRNTLMHLG